MTIKRELVDFNPLTGAFTEFAFDDATGELNIINGQDATSVIEANKAALTEPRFRKNGEDFRRVASLPLATFFDLKKRGIIDDPVAFKRWLNDIDNRYFRTNNEVV